MSEHRSLMAEAAGATHLIRSSGWIKVFRNAATQDKETRNVERWQRELRASRMKRSTRCACAQLNRISTHRSWAACAIRKRIP
ncbi:hypothetical protein GCM10023063_49830 [Arthrobacter methylotrophus]